MVPLTLEVTVDGGRIRLDAASPWPDGTRLTVVATPSDAEGVAPVPRLTLSLGSRLACGDEAAQGAAGTPSPLVGATCAAIEGLRARLLRESGVTLPTVEVRDDLRLGACAYRLTLDGLPVAEGTLAPGCRLVLSPDERPLPACGTPTVDPAFDIPARWVPQAEAAALADEGFVVVDVETVLSTHLGETFARHLPDLLDLAALSDALEERVPGAVRAVWRDSGGTLAALLPVVRQSLREGRSLDHLGAIVESTLTAASR
jgi:flagellar biosynthesis protein FlhA